MPDNFTLKIHSGADVRTRWKGVYNVDYRIEITSSHLLRVLNHDECFTL